jgi:hypothetical protein
MRDMRARMVYYRKSCHACGCDMGPAKRLSTQPEGEVLCFFCPYPEDDQRNIAKVLKSIGGGS